MMDAEKIQAISDYFNLRWWRVKNRQTDCWYAEGGRKIEMVNYGHGTPNALGQLLNVLQRKKAIVLLEHDPHGGFVGVLQYRKEQKYWPWCCEISKKTTLALDGYGTGRLPADAVMASVWNAYCRKSGEMQAEGS